MEIAAIVIGFIVGIAMGIYLATQIEQGIDKNRQHMYRNKYTSKIEDQCRWVEVNIKNTQN